MLQLSSIYLAMSLMFYYKIEEQRRLRRNVDHKYALFSLMQGVLMSYIFSNGYIFPTGSDLSTRTQLLGRILPSLYFTRAFYTITSHEDIIPTGSLIANVGLPVLGCLLTLIYDPMKLLIPAVDLVYSFYKYGLPSLSSSGPLGPGAVGTEWFGVA